MARILVVPVRRSGARKAGVPEDLAEETRALLVVRTEEDVEGIEGAGRGDVVLLGEGEEYGVYRAGEVFELRKGTQGAVVSGNVVGVLKKFRR